VCVSGHARKLHNTRTHFHDKIEKVGPPAPASSARFQAYEERLITFSFLFQHKQMYIHTHRGKIQERPELPPPDDDPPAAPVRRGTYCFAYALSLAIALFSV
jgi:hypothetical protein